MEGIWSRFLRRGLSFWSVSLILVIALVAAACSSGEDVDVTTSSPVTEAPQAPAAAEAAQAVTGSTSSAQAPVAAAPAATQSPSQAPSAPEKARITRLIFGVGGLGREYSVMRHGSQTESIQYRPEYEHLVAIDPVTGATIPQLATDWELLPDGLSFKFKLRAGVQFHRGWGEFTARDVVHTHEQLIREDSEHGQSFSWRRDVIGAEIVNDHEMIFRLSRPSAGFLSALGEQQSMIPVQSKAHFDAEGEPDKTESLYIAGTGPFQMQSRALGSFIRFDRVPTEHWRVTPDFEEFGYRFQSEPSTRLAALLAGETQVANLPVDLQVEAVSRGMKIARGPVPALRTWVNVACCWVDPDTGAYPAHPESQLSNVLARKALAKAIDRNLLNQAFFNNNAQPMFLNHWHPTRLGWSQDWERRFPEAYGYDPAAARELLAEAGFNSNNPMEVTFDLIELNHYSGARDVAEGIAGMFNEVGVKVNLQTRDSSVRRAASRSFTDFNHLRVAASSSDQFLGFAVWTTTLFSKTNANNIPAITEMTGTVLSTLDQQKQTALWTELGNASYDAYLTLPLFWLPAEALMDPEFVSDYVYPGSITGTWTHPEYIKAAQ